MGFSHSVLSCSEKPRFLEKRGVCSAQPLILPCDFEVNCTVLCCVLWENLGENLGTALLRRTLTHSVDPEYRVPFQALDFFTAENSIYLGCLSLQEVCSFLTLF